MFHIILFNPEIPSNTGNILRVCNNTGTFIHIIKPMGFQLSDKKLKRAGMDYINFENIKLYDNFEDCLNNNSL